MGNICSKKTEEDENKDEKIDTGLDATQEKGLEDDLKEVVDDPEFEDIEGQIFNVRERITEKNIKEPYLQEIYLGNTEEAISELHKVRLKK